MAASCVGVKGAVSCNWPGLWLTAGACWLRRKEPKRADNASNSVAGGAAADATSKGPCGEEAGSLLREGWAECGPGSGSPGPIALHSGPQGAIWGSRQGDASGRWGGAGALVG
eukprot:1141287-Pelagomonas_calceolata.AAC.4